MDRYMNGDEVMEVTVSFADKQWGSGEESERLRNEMFEMDRKIRAINDRLIEDGMGAVSYAVTTDEINQLADELWYLDKYAATALIQVQEELDFPLYKHFKNHASETISQIKAEELSTPNIIASGDEKVGSFQMNMLTYAATPRLYLADFMDIRNDGDNGLDLIGSAFEGLDGITEFRQLYKDEYDIIKGLVPEALTPNDYLEHLTAAGEFDHEGHHPLKNIVSSVLDIIIIKPILEAAFGRDFITQEDLSDYERIMKVGFAVLDAVMIGKAIKGTKLLQLGSKAQLKATANVLYFELLMNGTGNAVGQLSAELGLPVPIVMLLSFGSAGAVGMSASKSIREMINSEAAAMDFLRRNDPTYLRAQEVLNSGGVPKGGGKINHGGRIISDDIVEFVSEAGEGISKDGFGKLSGKSFNVTQEGINRVKNHISNNGFDAYENSEMIRRIEEALEKGNPITGADASYYMHELKENALMQGGMSYNEAHRASLDFFEVSDFSVYHPDVIQMDPEAWNSAWKRFWGIEQ